VKIEAYFDGAVEPRNPGGIPAYGSVVFVDGEKDVEISKIYHPEPGTAHLMSNNVAEYLGLISILEYLIKEELHEQKVTIYGDSKMVVNQVQGKWRIKQGIYVEFAHKARKLYSHFTDIKVRWIPREQNKLADELSKRSYSTK